MRIAQLDVKNFRAIRSATLTCDRATALLGRNGAGKSSFLHALALFYELPGNVTAEDFFGRETSQPIEITSTFCDLSASERSEFMPYIQDETLVVKKRITLDGRPEAKYYAAVSQIPAFADVRSESGRRERTERLKAVIASGQLAGLAGNPRSAQETDEIMATYEENHPELVQLIESEEQFFGPRNVGGGKLDKFTKFVLVPAVRDAADEVEGVKGAVHQLLDALVMRKLLAREDVVALQQGYTDRLQEMLGPEQSSELQELGASLSRELGRFAPGAELTLEWDEVPPVALQLPSARASVTEDAFPGHISRKGHGLQRAMVLILLQEMAKMQVEAETGPSLILGIEEPELFLHPARARYLSGLLHDLVAESGSDIIGQVIYTTHSPHFLDLHRFDSIRVIRKVATEEGVPLEVDVQAFELAAAIGELARITNQPVAQFTRDSFVARTVPVMTTVVNEGFFAGGVVLVEGLSDAAAIWVIQERLSKNWSEQDVVVIPVSGKNNLDRPTIILRGLGIPTYFVFDGDGTATGGEREKAITANHRCQRLAGVPEDDFPDTCAERDWACLHTDLEGELKAGLGEEVFGEIRQQVADHLGYASMEKVLKNADCVAEFVTHVYDRGLTLPFLERIVEAATALLCTEEEQGEGLLG